MTVRDLANCADLTHTYTVCTTLHIQWCSEAGGGRISSSFCFRVTAGAVVDWLCYLTHNQLIAQGHVFEPSWPNRCVCVFNPTRAGGRGGSTKYPPPPAFFLNFPCNGERYRNQILRLFLKFYGEYLICTSVCQLAGCCYGNKVLQHCFSHFLQKITIIKFAMVMLITGRKIGDFLK